MIHKGSEGDYRVLYKQYVVSQKEGLPQSNGSYSRRLSLLIDGIGDPNSQFKISRGISS